MTHFINNYPPMVLNIAIHYLSWPLEATLDQFRAFKKPFMLIQAAPSSFSSVSQQSLSSLSAVSHQSLSNLYALSLKSHALSFLVLSLFLECTQENESIDFV